MTPVASAPWVVGAAALVVVLVGITSESRLVSPRRPNPATGHRLAGGAAAPVARRSPRHRAGELLVSRLPHRSRQPGDEHVAAWCDALARRLRAGDTLAGALRSAPATAPLDVAIAPVVLALDRGADVATAVAAARHRSPGLDAAVTVIAACATLGGPAAEPIDRVAATMRRRIADAAERRAHSAQARLSAVTLTVLPGVVLALLATTSAAVRASLTTPAGAASVTAGALLNLAGWRWMGRIIGAAP